MTDRQTSNVPMAISDIIAAEIAATKNAIVESGADAIRTNGNQNFILPGSSIPAASIRGVIVDFLTENKYYDRPYNKNNPTPPACFAIGANLDSMAPHEKSPVPQSEVCKGCPQNEWGSDPQGGRGKACKNARLIAIKPIDEEGNIAEDAPVWKYAIPPASIKYFDKYIKDLMLQNTLNFAVVTEMTLDPDQTWTAPRFHMERNLSEEEAISVLSDRDRARELLIVPPDVSSFTPKGR